MDEEQKENLKNFRYDFGQLITKHPIRWEIWSILRYYPELNINQISQFLKQSRYTVSRHLKLMEKDGMVSSREIQPEKRGKYAPKYYRINPSMSGPTLDNIEELEEYMNAFFEPWKLPEQPRDRLIFYQNLIKEYITGIVNYVKSLQNMQFIFDKLKESISGITNPDDINLKIADELFKKYLEGIKEPLFLGLTFDQDHFKQFRELYKDYWRKIFLINFDQLKNPDPKGTYFGLMTVIFPTKAILELKKEIFSQK